jgi:hypothetical protein
MTVLALLILVGCIEPTVDTAVPAPPLLAAAPEQVPAVVEDVPAILVSDILPSAVQRGAAARRRAQARPVDFARLVADSAELGLFRIAGSEVEWANDRDIIGIWQVTRAVRARHCNNSRLRRARVLITQCQTATGEIVDILPEEIIEDAEETYVSAMRRLSRHVMGAAAARNGRQRWVRQVDLACQRPAAWPQRRSWGRLRPRCEEAVGLVRGLVNGRDRRRVTGAAVPIAWGGRCEVDGGACDDPLACRRGLARIPGTGTSNALWCRVGSRGCPAPVVQDGVVYSDEVCAALRIPAPSRVREVAEDNGDMAKSGDGDG